MRATTILAIAGLLLGVDACYVTCSDGSVVDVGRYHTPCPGRQTYVRAASGFADIVYFDGGRASSCADGEGFSLLNVRENVVGCGNGVRGSCCGRNRC